MTTNSPKKVTISETEGDVYQVIRGRHREFVGLAPNGKPKYRTYKRGEVLRSTKPLDKLFRNKFKKASAMLVTGGQGTESTIDISKHEAEVKKRIAVEEQNKKLQAEIARLTGKEPPKEPTNDQTDKNSKAKKLFDSVTLDNFKPPFELLAVGKKFNIDDNNGDVVFDQTMTKRMAEDVLTMLNGAVIE
jgi:hypothetical protein